MSAKQNIADGKMLMNGAGGKSETEKKGGDCMGGHVQSGKSGVHTAQGANSTEPKNSKEGKSETSSKSKEGSLKKIGVQSGQSLEQSSTNNNKQRSKNIFGATPDG
jgi:hypothetical protein